MTQHKGVKAPSHSNSAAVDVCSNRIPASNSRWSHDHTLIVRSDPHSVIRTLWSHFTAHLWMVGRLDRNRRRRFSALHHHQTRITSGHAVLAGTNFGHRDPISPTFGLNSQAGSRERRKMTIELDRGDAIKSERALDRCFLFQPERGLRA